MIEMRFTERSFSVVILAAVILITLYSGLSCAAQAPAPAPALAPAPAPESQANLNPDAPVVLKMSLPSSETVTGAKRVRSWLNSRIECIVEGTDTENLKYSWTYSNGTLRAGKGLSLEGGTAGVVDWMAPGAGGDYTVNVKVTDGHGNEARGQVSFKVVCCTE
jgi:hypothetical protein